MADWPEGISDGLILPCALCGIVSQFDWAAVDEVWREVAPSEHQRGVICLPCFETLATEAGITYSYITRIQFIGVGRTWDFREPGRMYVWSKYV